MINDKLAGDPARHLDPMVSLDQGQGEIDACGNPRRCPDTAIGYEDVIGLDPDGRVFSLKQMRDPPMGRRPAPRQQTRLRQQERPGTDAGDTRDLCGQRAHGGNFAGRPHRRDVAAGDDKRVQRDAFRGTAFNHGPTTAAYLAAGPRQDLQSVKRPAGDPGGGFERAKRPGEIQDLMAWIEEESDTMHCVLN